jgi:hypothetical protein
MHNENVDMDTISSKFVTNALKSSKKREKFENLISFANDKCDYWKMSGITPMGSQVSFYPYKSKFTGFLRERRNTLNEIQTFVGNSEYSSMHDNYMYDRLLETIEKQTLDPNNPIQAGEEEQVIFTDVISNDENEKFIEIYYLEFSRISEVGSGLVDWFLSVYDVFYDVYYVKYTLYV